MTVTAGMISLTRAVEVMWLALMKIMRNWPEMDLHMMAKMAFHLKDLILCSRRRNNARRRTKNSQDPRWTTQDLSPLISCMTCLRKRYRAIKVSQWRITWHCWRARRENLTILTFSNHMISLTKPPSPLHRTVKESHLAALGPILQSHTVRIVQKQLRLRPLGTKSPKIIQALQENSLTQQMEILELLTISKTILKENETLNSRLYKFLTPFWSFLDRLGESSNNLKHDTIKNQIKTTCNVSFKMRISIYCVATLASESPARTSYLSQKGSTRWKLEDVQILT